jgi:flagellar biosynthesis regulator FlaF
MEDTSMSYLRKAPPRRYVRRRSLGDDIYDPVSGVLIYQDDTQSAPPSVIGGCLNQANDATAPFDARVNDLAQNWQPTGFYTASDIRSIVSSVMATISQAQALVDQAAKEPNASQDSVMQATDDLSNAGKKSIDYLQAANQADAQGTRAINAVGLKRWVTDSLGAASNAMATALVIGCITPWWVGALAAFQSAFDKAWTLVRAVAGTVLQIGEDALTVVDHLQDIYNVLKWGALALGAYWLWTNVLEPEIR